MFAIGFWVLLVSLIIAVVVAVRLYMSKNKLAFNLSEEQWFNNMLAEEKSILRENFATDSRKYKKTIEHLEGDVEFLIEKVTDNTLLPNYIYGRDAGPLRPIWMGGFNGTPIFESVVYDLNLQESI